MKRVVNRMLRRFGYELRSVSAPAGSGGAGHGIDAEERRSVDAAIDAYVASLDPGSPFADAAEWRRYLSDLRLAFSEDVVRVCRENDVKLEGQTIGDIGCGTGYLLRCVSRAAPGATLTGFDPLEEALLLSQRMCPDATFEARDLASVQGAFDVVFCTEVLEHLVAPEAALEHMGGLVRPGGALVLTVPDGRQDRQEAGERRPDGSAYVGHIHFWSPESWRLFVERTLPSSRNNFFGRIATGENCAVVRM